MACGCAQDAAVWLLNHSPNTNTPVRGVTAAEGAPVAPESDWAERAYYGLPVRSTAELIWRRERS